MKKQVYIIGAGPGNIDNLTDEGKNLIKECSEIYAFKRIGNINTKLRKDINICTYKEIVYKINASKAKTIGVLVSGDTGFFSMAKILMNKLKDNCNIEFICGISSMQYFLSKIGISYENLKVVSLHGRKRSILGDISYNKYVFLLTDKVNSPDKICKKLCKEGLSHLKVYVGEHLSMENERIVKGRPLELSQIQFDGLSVVLIENNNYVNKNEPLFDEDFIRDKVPMTKEEIRWVSVNYLKINPDNIIFDIGAGTGSVSIEMARKAYEGIVYAIEKKENAFYLIKDNIEKLGAYNVKPILGEATKEIQKLPIPDKVFIGGSGGTIEEIIRYFHNLNKEIDIVVNAITLETLTKTLSILKDINCSAKVVCINGSKNELLGNYNLMKANNPVYIISSKI